MVACLKIHSRSVKSNPTYLYTFYVDRPHHTPARLAIDAGGAVKNGVIAFNNQKNVAILVMSVSSTGIGEPG